MKQKTRKLSWLLPIAIIMLFALAGCVRPAPQPDVTETPVPPPDTVEMPTAVPPTTAPVTDPYPGTDAGEPAPDGETNPDDGQVVEEATAVPEGQPSTHTVQDGDTLSTLSQQYGVSEDELAAANNITTSSELTAGQTLVIPAPGEEVAQPDQPPTTEQPSTGEQVHVVQPGDNLFRISLRYGKTVDEVAAYNGIANPHYIYPGQVIRIP